MNYEYETLTQYAMCCECKAISINQTQTLGVTFHAHTQKCSHIFLTSIRVSAALALATITMNHVVVVIIGGGGGVSQLHFMAFYVCNLSLNG